MDLNGIYRGFSPTDESGAGVGELEVVIGDDSLMYRFATGLEVLTDQLPRSALRQLSAEEVTAHFAPGIDTSSAAGYMLYEQGTVFLFLPQDPRAPEEPGVMVLRFVSHETDMLFGPTCLFTPAQVQAGCFERAVDEIEARQGDSGVIPRLTNNGRRL